MVLNTDEKYNARIASMREFTYDWKPENYDDPSKPILKITKSSLGSFDWCPKKYDFSYIQRLPQDQTEAMRKGTILHNHRENFFNDFDIKKAETMNNSEVLDYCTSLLPIDEYYDDSLTMASFEAQRFIEARSENKIEEFLPIVNEGKFDAEIIIPANLSDKYPLRRNYVIHIQGIIDRIFIENGSLIPFEFKTGQWKDYKSSSMRKEMAFYQLLIENASEEVLEKNGLTKDMKVSHWGWYYPISNYIAVEPIKTRSMTSVMTNIAKLIHAYENNEFPTKWFYKTCSHCSYFGICDAANIDTWV
jgi:CRISPR/Cas system-associated exonuclease Cas4 (RecB family)